MKTIIATAALTIMFLSAGAFAGGHHRMVQMATAHNLDNVTVVAKNSAWPVLLEGQGTATRELIDAALALNEGGSGLLDKNGKPHSLHEFSGQPYIVVLIQGAFCKHCMTQLAEFQQQLDASKVPIVVVTPIDDLDELADIPFAVFADPEFNQFKSLHAFRDEPLHGTFVFNSRGEILLKDIGSEPYTDFAAIKKALKESVR
jgi:peroxiredoxin